MTATLSRIDDLRNDLENMHVSIRYYIGILAELEQLGRTNSEEFRGIEKAVNILKQNARRVEAEIERLEEETFEI